MREFAPDREAIEMKLLVFVACLASLLTGCGQRTPTYQLTISAKVIDLPVHKDPTRIQDDIIAQIKPLWDQLDSGDSAIFRYKRVGPLDLGPGQHELDEKAKAKLGDGAKLTSTETCESLAYRFYKNRNGTNGIEQLGDGKRPPVSCGTVMDPKDWGMAERLLRDDLISIEVIRIFIQLDHAEGALDERSTSPCPLSQGGL